MNALSRHLMFQLCAAMLVIIPVCAPAWAQQHATEPPAEGASPSAPPGPTPGMDPEGAYAGTENVDAPSIPIFFNEAYEGRLSLENSVKTGYRKLSYFKYEPAPQPIAFFYIDLYEKEKVTFGIQTDSPKDLQVNFTFEKVDRKGVRKWVSQTGGTFGFSSKRRCTLMFQADETRRYRIEIFPQEVDVEANYKLIILPRNDTELPECDEKLSSPAVALFDAPGKPASLEIAKSWQGRTFVPTMAAPPVYTADAGPDAEAYASGKPQALQGFYRALHADGEHNAVLNFQRLGLAAMEAGEYGEAEWAFDQALERIEAFYGSTETAKAARSKWTSEGIKDYKGEPYERVMAYYYRGLLYLRAGDYQNARAAFVAGEFQDTLSETEEFQGDFALMNYLAGWSSYCGGDTGLADEAFALAEKVNPAIRRPRGETTLLVADIGRAPVKFGRGLGGRLLTFVEADQSGAEDAVTVTTGSGKQALGQTLPVYTDVSFQATTRGGRAFDTILDGKASLQHGARNTVEVGYLMTQTGILPLQVAGLLITAISGGVHGKVRPDADIRVWDTLPHHVSVGLSGQAATAPVAYLFQGEHALAGGTPVMRAQSGKCGIAWSRSRSALDVQAGAPGNYPDVVAARLKRADAMQRDAVFREALRDAGGESNPGAVAP
jgi:tetratricopeptide (TPR) repeat protein